MLLASPERSGGEHHRGVLQCRIMLLRSFRSLALASCRSWWAQPASSPPSAPATLRA